jgi:hypothetical protein
VVIQFSFHNPDPELLVIYKQIRYMLNKDLGLTRNSLVIRRTEALQKNIKAFRDEIKTIPGGPVRPIPPQYRLSQRQQWIPD